MCREYTLKEAADLLQYDADTVPDEDLSNVMHRALLGDFLMIPYVTDQRIVAYDDDLTALLEGYKRLYVNIDKLNPFTLEVSNRYIKLSDFLEKPSTWIKRYEHLRVTSERAHKLYDALHDLQIFVIERK